MQKYNLRPDGITYDTNGHAYVALSSPYYSDLIASGWVILNVYHPEAIASEIYVEFCKPLKIREFCLT